MHQPASKIVSNARKNASAPFVKFTQKRASSCPPQGGPAEPAESAARHGFRASRAQAPELLRLGTIAYARRCGRRGAPLPAIRLTISLKILIPAAKPDEPIPP
jgi:hypothetical protein